VPTTLPAGRFSKLVPFGVTSASAGFSRRGTAATTRSSGTSVGTSFIEWTAASTSPSKTCRSSERTNAPVFPRS